jgi:isopentenyl-diphosphate delta-isomerase
MPSIQSRKTDHLDLASRGDVAFKQKTTLFESVQLVHDALPELSLDAIDLSTHIVGKPLRAPLLIAGMTGGTDRAGEINRALSRIAQECGYAFGLGSQRPMLRDPAARSSYAVRDVAPDVLLLGNIGAVQASQTTTDEIAKLVDDVQVDALCVHLNPAMEVVQPEGDRSFEGCLAALERLVRALDKPVIAKETGCGISRAVARRLRNAGVEHVDVSGSGGTSWVAVEAQRAADGQRELGNLFWDWGIPTAASVMAVAGNSFRTIFATGGITNGLEVAKAIVLGADVVGIARPVLQAYDRGGPEGAEAFLRSVEEQLRTAMLLVGASNLRNLRTVPRIVGDPLSQWQSLWESQSSP